MLLNFEEIGFGDLEESDKKSLSFKIYLIYQFFRGKGTIILSVILNDQ